MGAFQGVLDLPVLSNNQLRDAELLEQIKLLSGRAIEERRRHARTTQEQLAKRTGIGVRWIREIESGNPKSSIDNHIKCASSLGMPVSYLLIPLLFMEKEMSFPVGFLVDNFAGLQDRAIQSISDYYIETLSRHVRPGRDTTQAHLGA
ncbi:hypothetical protein BH10PSE12_BH10PSE12_08580 [soil metagenome]